MNLTDIMIFPKIAIVYLVITNIWLLMNVYSVLTLTVKNVILMVNVKNASILIT